MARFVDTCAKTQQCGFAGAVVPNEPHAIPVFNRQREILQRADCDVPLISPLSPNKPTSRTAERAPESLLRAVDRKVDCDVFENQGGHALYLD